MAEAIVQLTEPQTSFCSRYFTHHRQLLRRVRGRNGDPESHWGLPRSKTRFHSIL